MPEKTTQASKITTSIKGLQTHLQPDEQPQLDIPGIWDNGQQQYSTMCDIILTNQRIFGFYYKKFPREHLFLDAINLSDITNVSLRKKQHEPLFRELLIEAGTHKVYIRAPLNKLEPLYNAMQEFTHVSPESDAIIDAIAASVPGVAGFPPTYGRQEIRASFENSPLAIAILFIGGILLELTGVYISTASHSSPSGLSLCFAGFAAVITAIILRSKRSSRKR
jgi:hypothetical protein